MTVKSNMVKEMHVLLRQRLYEECLILKPNELKYLLSAYGDPFEVKAELLDWYCRKVEEFQEKALEEL